MKRCPQCGKQYASEANFCPVDAARLEDLPDDGAATGDDHVLGGRFVVGDPLGGSATGQVFRATDKESGHACIVKWVDPAVFSSSLQLQRTERELKQLERQDAAGIARVLGHGKRDDKLWIATEYVAGTRLDELLKTVGQLPLVRATKIVHDVGVALAEAAKLGVIHRDVSPKNVLVSDGDEVHVINFGVAVPATPSVRGVPEFVAPEQVDGKPVDQRSNIYSLGAMLFSLLTGKPPFEGEPEAVHNAHLHTPAPHASDSLDYHESIASELDRLLDRALAKQSSKRFMTLRQLLGELEKLAGIEPASTQRMTSASSAPASASSSVPEPSPEPTASETESPEPGPADVAAGSGKGKAKAQAEPNETLLGVAAFEKPQGGFPSKTAAVEAPTSGVAALAPPVTQPPPVAMEPASIPAAVPIAQSAPVAVAPEQPDAEADAEAAVATNVLPISTQEPVAAEPAAAEPAAEVPSEAAPSEAAPSEAAPAEAAPAEAAPAEAAPAEAAPAEVAAQVAAEPAAPVPEPEPAVGPSALAQAQAQARVGGSANPADAVDGRSTASGKRRKRRKTKSKKKPGNKFRETMWFKKGELDEAAAEAAAADPSGSLVSAKADEMLTEDRYKDDGSISDEDRDRLSLRTGHTQMMSAMDDKSFGESGKQTAVSAEELAREMTGGNKRLLIAGGVVALVVIIIIIAVAA